MRKKIYWFVSYAHKNKMLADRFLEEFKEQTAPSRRYQYEFWRDQAILPGEDWHREIQAALERCHMGLLLISPAFLASSYIRVHELPPFTRDDAKPVIPVMLKAVDLKLQGEATLERLQVFALENPRFRKAKSYADCSSRHRDEFVRALFAQVEERLTRLTRPGRR
jgi:hypothetical protein